MFTVRWVSAHVSDLGEPINSYRRSMQEYAHWKARDVGYRRKQPFTFLCQNEYLT